MLHYGVANRPGAVPRTSSLALSNATLRHVVRLADFGIDVVLTEGQVYMTDRHRSGGLLYAGLFSQIPGFRLELREVKTSGEKQAAEGGVKADFLFSTPEATEPRPYTVGQGLPQLKNGMFLRVKGSGYSPRFALKKAGQVLDTAFVSLRLYPFGSEDYFRLLSPHTFYVQYYPGHMEGEIERPLKVRIIRNKNARMSFALFGLVIVTVIYHSNIILVKVLYYFSCDIIGEIKLEFYRKGATKHERPVYQP